MVAPWRRCEVPALEYVHVGWIVRHVEAPFIDLFAASLFPIILHDAKLSEHAAADDHAVVAAAAAGVHERP